MMDVMFAMQKLATALDTITGLRVIDHPQSNVSPPWAQVSLPTISFDTTMQRGVDRAEFEVLLVVGKRNDRAAADKITSFIEGIKDAIDDSTDFQTADVSACRIDVGDIGGVEYLIATFDVWVEAGDELQAP